MFRNIRKYPKSSWIHEGLFWLHALVFFGAIGASFFLNIYLTLIIIILHRLHIGVFGECIITKLHKTIGTFPDKRETTWLSVFVERIFKKQITRSQDYIIEGALVVFILVASSVTTFIL